jgi:replicative DNA helicase
VIALAQVNRDCERRDNKRPYQGDLADSSEIEKEADEIITLYRDEVYNEKTVDVGVAELLICKNRHGPTGAIRTSWIGQFMQFRDLSRASYDDY